MRIIVVEHESALGVSEGFLPNSDIFSEVLKSWGVPEPLLEKMTIILEVRDMIPDGVFGGRNGDFFLIYLETCLFGHKLDELNAVIAHELKHLWYLVKMPTNGLKFVEGFWINKRNHRWEGKECRRMEKKHYSTRFITVQGAVLIR